MAVNDNADSYANARVGIYFPGFPSSLTGQCVSLDKWFLGEMCGIGDWQSARGNAKDFGDSLVNQGLATVVAESQRKRGDIVVWKSDGGGYGHTGVLLSGDRVFEENVGLQGTPSTVVEGNRVYSARIDPLYANWRKGGPSFYRVKTYIENINGGNSGVAIIQNADNWRARLNRTAMAFWGRNFTEQEFQSFVGQDTLRVIEVLGDNSATDAEIGYAQIGRTADADHWGQQISDLQAALADRPTKDQLAQAQTIADNLQTKLTEADAETQAKIEENAGLTARITADEAKAAADTAAGDTLLRRIGQFIAKYLPGK